PLSHVVCSHPLQKAFRALDAYLNFLMGKGSGTGWDMGHEIQAAVFRIYRDAPIVFDVGGHMGDWSKRLLQVLPHARVYIFEPSPDSCREIQARNIKYAMLIPNAVGAGPGKAKLNRSFG